MGVSDDDAPVRVRPSRGDDLPAIEALSRRVYPHDHPWTVSYLEAQRDRFPEGQLVAVKRDSGDVVGMAASVRLPPALEEADAPYPIVTGDFRFTCHDPDGRVLYAAEVMVDPRARRQGIGGRIYAARRALAERLGVDAIRAAARLPGYGARRHELDLERYVREVEAGRLHDATLSFQLGQGFRVVKPLGRYFPSRDPESLGYAALIEWQPRG